MPGLIQKGGSIEPPEPPLATGLNLELQQVVADSVSKLEGELDCLKRQLNNTFEEKFDKEQLVSKLEGEVDCLKRQLNNTFEEKFDKEQLISKLEGELDCLKRQLNNTFEEKLDKEQLVRKLEGEVNCLKRQLNNTFEEKLDKEQLVRKLEGEVDCLKRQLNNTFEEKETGEIMCKFQRILNKLKLDNFDSLSEQVMMLKINSEKRLKGCVDRICVKAFYEPRFGVYAKLCSKMSKLCINTACDGEQRMFSEALLNTAHNFFLKFYNEMEYRRKISEDLEVVEETQSTKERIKAELSSWEVKSRKMFKNILRFFVELYQLSMLDKATLHQYLHQLETSPCEGCAEMLTEVHSMLPQSVGGRSGKVEIKVRDQDKPADTLKEFQGILNKLTPQKFYKLAEQASRLTVDSIHVLEGCVSRTFRKAVEEPHYSPVYAQLCEKLRGVSVLVDGKKTLTFQRSLLIMCQTNFMKTIKVSEQKLTDHKCYLGNIRFIGELFKVSMLSESIIHECLADLLRASAIEGFCCLISCIGEALDKPQSKEKFDLYFNQTAQLIKSGQLPSRLKFMLQDIQELRARNWVPRAVQTENSLKTIDQIHEEFKIERRRNS